MWECGSVRTLRILSPYDNVVVVHRARARDWAPPPYGSHHVIPAGVVADGRRVHPLRGVYTIEVELRGAVQDVPDRAPVDEVVRVVDRYAGEELEGRRDDVVVVITWAATPPLIIANALC